MLIEHPKVHTKAEPEQPATAASKSKRPKAQQQPVSTISKRTGWFSKTTSNPVSAQESSQTSPSQQVPTINHRKHLLSISTIPVTTFKFKLDSTLLFDFDSLHNLLVIACGTNYCIFLGSVTESVLENTEVHPKKSLRFDLAKASILDNEIMAVAFKNLRLYLLDEHYSLVVFSLSLTT